MAAAQREIAFYLKDQLLPKNSAVIVIGPEAEIVKGYLPSEFSIETCSFKNLPQGKTGHYDAAIAIQVSQDILQRDDIAQFFASVISILKPNGLLEVFESLDGSKYNLNQYTNLLEAVRFTDAQKNFFALKLLWEQSLRDSIAKKRNWHDHCWLLKVTELAECTNGPSVRDYLDKSQYTEYRVRSYEWIFGAGFISPGGGDQNKKFLSQLDLKPTDVMLDIGSGTGGNGFQTAKEFGSQVIGVDLSSNMVSIACDRACLHKDTRVRFMIADIMKHEFPPSTFDIVYSRDCIIHIADKELLFKKIFNWLKPGGKMLITDYMIGEQELHKEYQDFIIDRQYTLFTLNGYVETAKKAGFCDIAAADITDQLKETIEVELKQANTSKQEFFQMFPYEHLIEGWKSKLGYIACGDMKWGVIMAVKT